MSKLSGEFKAVWNGIQLILSEKEYDIAMSHVEHMRQVAADKNTIKTPKLERRMRTILSLMSLMSLKGGNYRTLFMRFLRELSFRQSGRGFLMQI
jgi:hypothetical protein